MRKLVIMAGLPGAGKSYISEHFFQNFKKIDCDVIKQTLPEYDPKNPTLVHAQSKALEKELLYKYLANGESFVYDTTATNSDYMISLIKEAQALNYETTFVYVKVDLATALNRNAQRDRIVPEAIVLEKYECLTSCVSTISNFADHNIEIDNNQIGIKFVGKVN